MNITKENIDELNAVVKINIEEKDYREKVDNVLKGYKKQVKMPGFRPGHVPFGMVKKMYGTTVLADELNKMINEQLNTYITDNKIEILGNPLPKDDNELAPDFENKKDFEFTYELGLAPSFDVKLSDKDKFTKYIIKVDDSLIDKQVEQIAKRFGKVSQGEKATEKDMLNGEFVELDKDGNVVEGGITNTSTIALEFIEDAKAKKALVGKKVDDVIVVDPAKVSRGGADTAAMLNVDKSALEGLSKKFQFTVKHIYQMEPAEINAELFEKVFGKDACKDEKEFRAKVSEDIKTALGHDSDRKLMIDVTEDLQKKFKLQLPDEFLKRWLLMANENKLTTEQIESDYEEYAKGLKWQLIENKIIKENDIIVSHDDAVAHTIELLKMQMAQYGAGMELPEEEMKETANRVLQNQEEAKKIYDQIYNTRVTETIKNSVKLKDKEVSYDEFVKLVSGKGNRFSDMFNSLKNSFNK